MGRRKNLYGRYFTELAVNHVNRKLVSRFEAASLLRENGIPITAALRLLAGVKMGAIDTRNEAFFQHRDSGKTGTQHNHILTRIKASNTRYGPHDFSLREIAAITGLEINAVSGRCNELKQAGALVEQNQRPCRVTRRTITPLALAETVVAMELAV